MASPSNVFGEYLASDESVVTAAPGTLIDGSIRSEGSIGVTDRRVLFLSADGDRFLEVAHDAIDAIRSRRAGRFSKRGIALRLLSVSGALVGTVAFLGVTVFESTVLALFLMLLAVGGMVGAEYVRRHGADVAWNVPNGGFGERLGDPVGAGALRRHLERTDGGVGREPVVVALGILSLTALIGLIARTESLIVIPLALVALGGISLTDYAARRRRALDDSGLSRRGDREMGIHVGGDWAVRLRFDGTEHVDHELSRLAREGERTSASIELTRSEG